MFVIIYLMSKQKNSSCLPTLRYDVTIPGTNPMDVASIRSMDRIPILNRLSRIW